MDTTTDPTSTKAPPVTPEPISEPMRIACDVATGELRDPDAVGIQARGAWRDLNSKGNGVEVYRRALSPGGAWRFVSDRLPRGTSLAEDRRATVYGDVYVGDLLADYRRTLRGSASQGEAKHDDQIGLVVERSDDGKPSIHWMPVVRQKGGSWRVVLPTGAHLTFQPAGWR